MPVSRSLLARPHRGGLHGHQFRDDYRSVRNRQLRELGQLGQGHPASLQQAPQQRRDSRGEVSLLASGGETAHHPTLAIAGHRHPRASRRHPHPQIRVRGNAGEVGKGRAQPAEILSIPGGSEPLQQTRLLKRSHHQLTQRFGVSGLACRVGIARHLAYLTDRVLVSAGKPQLYGTQYSDDGNSLQPQPVHDPEHLDERRAAMGLDTAAEYDQRMRKTYTG
ncbi:DUF6624 domain-containing protein [Streptomyces lydicus]|uniref:DUF6624 domain-containing protein n=1 Tax=Streptomyces lydicus TaxID=47763 RepID=UPI0037BA09AB